MQFQVHILGSAPKYMKEIEKIMGSPLTDL